jgi:hypothetical protein
MTIYNVVLAVRNIAVNLSFPLEACLNRQSFDFYFIDSCSKVGLVLQPSSRALSGLHLCHRFGRVEF